MDKKSKFRKILATTSALAVIVGGVSSAMGFDFVSNGGVLAKIGNLQPVVGLVSVPAGQANWTAGDNVNINAANNLDLGIIAGNHQATVGTITVTQGGRTINVLEHSSAVSVANGGNTALLVIADNMNFTLNGAVMTGLGNITIGAGGGGTESLIINAGTELAPVVLGGTIDGGGANEGTITVNANKAVTFNAVIGGGQPLKAFTLAADSIVNLGANASVGNNGLVLTGANTQLNVANGVTITGKVSGGALNNGIMKFAGAGIVTAQIGNGGALKEIIANGAGVVALNHAGAVVAAEKLTIADAGADVQLAGGFTGATVFNANGQVTLADGKTITGAVTTTSNTDAIGTKGGKLVVAANGVVTGLIGTDANRLDTVQVTGAGKLELTANGAGQNHYARVFNLGNAGSEIEVAANGTLHGDFVATNANSGIVRFLGAGEITGKIGNQAGNAIAKVEANGAGVVKIGAGDHKIITLDLKNAGSVFTFADGANVMGRIQNTQGGANGVVNFTGNGEITGTTGAAGIAALATVNLNGDEDSVVKFGDKITAANINTVNGGTLELNGVAGNDIVGSLNFTANGGGLLISGDEAHNVGVITTVGNVGTVEIKNTVGAGAPRLIKFEGKIGNNLGVNSLALFKLDSGANLVTAKFMTASTGSQITAIEIGNGGGILQFAEANAVHKIGGITAALNNKGTIKITNSTTFESTVANAEVTFGTAQERLAGVELANAQTLTIGDNINIYATKLFGTANGDGILSFAGSSTFSAPSVNGNAIVDINVLGGAGKIVKLLDVTEITGNATVADNGTLEISNHFTGVDIKGAGLNNGTVRFTNAAAMTVNGTVGAGNSLSAIEFAGGNVNFNGAVTHSATKSFTFTDEIKAATTVTFDANTNVGTNNFVNSTTKGFTHTVILNKNLTDFAGVQLAADANKHINFQLDLGKDVTLSAATVANGANFTTGQDGKGVLTFNTNNAGTVNSVGAVAKALADVQFDKSMTVTNGLFATNTNVAGAQIATVGGKIAGTTFTLAADNSKVILSNGAFVDVAITATTHTKGLVEFAGNATLNKDIGSVGKAPASVTFSDVENSVQALNTDNIFATTIALRKGKVKLSKNILLTGATTATNGSFALHDKKLTVAAANTLAFSGSNNISLDVAVNGSVITGSGQIESLGTLEFGAGTTITVTPNGGVAGLVGGQTIRTSVITSANAVADGKTLDLSKATIVQPDTFTKWASTAGAKGGLDLIIADNSQAALLEILGSTADDADRANVAAITNAAFGTDGNKVRELLRSLNTGGVPNKAKVDETLDRLPAVTTVSDAVESTASAVSMGMSQRMTNLVGSQGAQNRTVASSGSASGIAAGDEGARFGVWASPFFGKTTQK
jgi:hypothetical protein